MKSFNRWFVVVLFAVAMAWVESAVVFYLRTMIGRIEPYQPNPLPIATGLGRAEVVREFATLTMLVAVGWLAGTTRRQRFAYALVAFGVWDIFYYVWLKVLTGWPHSLLDWDVLFLIPLPWWGPVLAPVLISLLMITWGTLTAQTNPAVLSSSQDRKFWVLNLTGVTLALYVFMTDALRVMSGGERALRALLPTSFNWPLFLVALGLMAAPVVNMLRMRKSTWSPALAPKSANDCTSTDGHINAREGNRSSARCRAGIIGIDNHRTSRHIIKAGRRRIDNIGANDWNIADILNPERVTDDGAGSREAPGHGLGRVVGPDDGRGELHRCGGSPGRLLDRGGGGRDIDCGYRRGRRVRDRDRRRSANAGNDRRACRDTA